MKLQVALLVHTRSSETVPQESKGSQTDFKEEFRCQVCVFQCKSNADLRLHTEKEHSSDELTHIINYPCNNCGKSFNEKWELMVHRKEEHTSAVKTCTFFLREECAFDDDDCWFRHPKTDHLQRKVLPKILEFKCGICGKKFNRKKDFMEHRKEEHYNHVSDCIENENGSCRFTSNECWYKHTKVMYNGENQTEVGGIKTSDLIKRLFDMMEVFSDRMASLENQK